MQIEEMYTLGFNDASDVGVGVRPPAHQKLVLDDI